MVYVVYHLSQLTWFDNFLGKLQKSNGGKCVLTGFVILRQGVTSSLWPQTDREAGDGA